MDIEKLKQVGLSEKESEIYLALLELDDALVSEIAEKTKINRSLLYSILSDLIDKGLVTYVLKNNTRYYRAVEPQKILNFLEEKEKAFRSILPELMSLHKSRKDKLIVEILEGKEGIKTILMDILRLKEEWLAFGSSGKGPEILPYYVEHWERERQKQKIKLKAILDLSTSGLKRGKDLSKLKYTEIKYTLEKYLSPTSTWVYGDRFVFIVWSKGHPFAIRTISKDIVESYKSHFQKLWKIAKK